MNLDQLDFTFNAGAGHHPTARLAGRAAGTFCNTAGQCRSTYLVTRNGVAGGAVPSEMGASLSTTSTW